MFSINLKKIGFLIFIFLFYVTINQVYSVYYQYYNIPFGKDDVDNYLNMFKENYDIIHLTFIKFISILSFFLNYSNSRTLSFILPIIFGIITPLILYIFFRLNSNSKQAISKIYLTILNTYFIWFGFIVAIWAQYFSVLCFLISIFYLIIYRYSPYPKKIFLYNFLIIGLVSILFHPYTLFIYIILGISYTYYKNKCLMFGLILLELFLIFNIYPKNIYQWTIFGLYNYTQPTFYAITFLFINPIILFLACMHIQNNRDYNIYPKFIYLFCILGYIIGIFSENSRGLIYFQPFIICMAYQEYIFLKQKYKYISIVFWILSIIFGFYLYTFYLDQMYIGLLARGLKQEGFKLIFGIK